MGLSEARVLRAPAVLVTYGLGSCLGIALYAKMEKLGGLAHTLLPVPRAGVEETRPAKFAASAIRLMVAELTALGADHGHLWAKLVGGATMFEPMYGTMEEGIGFRNIRAARDTLGMLKIPIVAEDVGGSHGRTVEFDLGTGEVRVRSVRGSDRLLVL